MIIEFKLEGGDEPIRLWISNDLSMSEYCAVWRAILDTVLEAVSHDMRPIEYIKQIKEVRE